MIFFGRIPPWPAEVVFTPVIFGPVIFMLITLTLATPNTAMAAGWTDLWLTPDQQAQRMAEDGQWAEAAGRFTRPEHIGYAWYRAGEFEKAAAALGRAPGAAPAYNRGNALVMLGRYEAAIDAYQRALELRPDWVEAEQNMALARIRLAALAPPEDDAGGTGGMLGVQPAPAITRTTPHEHSTKPHSRSALNEEQAVEEDARADLDPTNLYSEDPGTHQRRQKILRY